MRARFINVTSYNSKELSEGFFKIPPEDEEGQWGCFVVMDGVTGPITMHREDPEQITIRAVAVDNGRFTRLEVITTDGVSDEWVMEKVNKYLADIASISSSGAFDKLEGRHD